MIKIRAPKDFWSGMLFIAIGAAGVILARDYPFGSALRMGPGYLPSVLSWLTAGLGVIVLVRSFAISGEAVGSIGWRPLVLVLAAIIMFGLLIGGIRFGTLEIGTSGLVLAIIGSTIVGGFASHEFGKLEMLLLALALATFSTLVFIKGLGQPMEIWPAWWPQGWRL